MQQARSSIPMMGIMILDVEHGGKMHVHACVVDAPRNAVNDSKVVNAIDGVLWAIHHTNKVQINTHKVFDGMLLMTPPVIHHITQYTPTVPVIRIRRWRTRDVCQSNCGIIGTK